MGVEVLRSRFPYILVSRAGRKGQSGGTQDAITDSMAHAHGTTRQMRHAASGLDGSRGCPSYARRRRESTCGSTLPGDPETRGAVPGAGLRRSALAACLLLRLLLLLTETKETLIEGASVSSIIEDEKASEKDASKNRAP